MKLKVTEEFDQGKYVQKDPFRSSRVVQMFLSGLQPSL